MPKADRMGCDKKKSEYELYMDLIKDNIEYDALKERYPLDAELIDGIVEMMTEVTVSTNDYIVIASNSFPKEVVKSRFLKLNFSHLEYVMSCFKSNTTKVKNIKKYLLASLFNAPSTMNGYYTAEVNHDMPQYASRRIMLWIEQKDLVKYIIAIIMFICRVTIVVLGSLLKIFLVLTIAVFKIVFSLIRVVEYN